MIEFPLKNDGRSICFLKYVWRPIFSLGVSDDKQVEGCAEWNEQRNSYSKFTTLNAYSFF